MPRTIRRGFEASDAYDAGYDSALIEGDVAYVEPSPPWDDSDLDERTRAMFYAQREAWFDGWFDGRKRALEIDAEGAV